MPMADPDLGVRGTALKNVYPFAVFGAFLDIKIGEGGSGPPEPLPCSTRTACGTTGSPMHVVGNACDFMNLILFRSTV